RPHRPALGAAARPPGRDAARRGRPADLRHRRLRRRLRGGHHAHLRRRRGARRAPAGDLRARARCGAGGDRRGPGRRAGARGRRRSAQGDRGRRVRAEFHPPGRPRPRARGARGPVPDLDERGAAPGRQRRHRRAGDLRRGLGGGTDRGRRRRAGRRVRGAHRRADRAARGSRPVTTIRAATDVGGTFTDLVYFYTDPETGAQEIVTAKADTTPPDFEQGVLNVIEKGGVSLAEIVHLAHGTTVVINARTERRGVVTALITTEGFRDVLEIARGNRPDFFNLHYEKPPPFVPRRLRREVPGRLTQDGRERAPLDVGGLPEILDDF